MGVYSGAPFLPYLSLSARSLTPLALSGVFVGRKAVYVWVCLCVPLFVSACVSLTQDGTKEPLTQRGQGTAESLH